jgi:hypothetical protein
MGGAVGCSRGGRGARALRIEAARLRRSNMKRAGFGPALLRLRECGVGAPPRLESLGYESLGYVGEGLDASGEGCGFFGFD